MVDADDAIHIDDPQPRRRKSDTAIGAAREAGFKVLLNYGATGVFSAVLLGIGYMYFSNAEARSKEFIGEQREQINEQRKLLEKTNEAFAATSRESTKVIAENTAVMREVRQELRTVNKTRALVHPADVIDLEEFRKP